MRVEEGTECPARAMHLTNVCPDVSAERKELRNTCMRRLFHSLSNGLTIYIRIDLSAAGLFSSFCTSAGVRQKGIGINAKSDLEASTLDISPL